MNPQRQPYEPCHDKEQENSHVYVMLTLHS
jgi:hypothetical protein